MKVQTKEWTREQHLQVDNAIFKQFAGRKFLNHRNEVVCFPHDMEQIENILGLPYTSTSMCPMISLDCNVHIYSNSKYHYDFAAINEDGEVVFALVDDEENRIYLKAI